MTQYDGAGQRFTATGCSSINGTKSARIYRDSDDHTSHTSFHIGDGMAPPPTPSIHVK